jgi:(hydroxyamino)benzene mutase
MMQTPEDVAQMLRLKAAGLAIKQIARKMGCSKNTVRRYLRGGGWVAYKRPERKGALRGLAPWLAERLQRHRGNADVVRQDLEREHGITVSLRTVERAVMSIDMTPYVNCTQIPKLLSRQGHRLLQIGVGLFLFTSFEGFAIPYLAAPGLGRSVHTLSAFQGVFLLSLGLAWPKLILGAKTSRIAFWLLIYSSFAILAAFVMAGVLGAGNETMPLAAGAAHGSDFQETVIKVVAYWSAPTGLTSFGLILWGLRITDSQSRSGQPERPSEMAADR